MLKSLFLASKECSLVTSLDTAVLKHSISVVVVKRTRSVVRSWNRSVESVKATALDLCPGPQEPDTKTTGSKGPEKATNWCGYEGA